MSQLNVNTITTLSGTDITIPTGKKLVVTDSGGLVVPGTVVQIAQGALSGTGVSTTSTSKVTFGANASITPKSSSNSILVLATGGWYTSAGTATEFALSLDRSGTVIGTDGLVPIYASAESGDSYSITYWDSPSTTSSITYTVKAHRINPGNMTLYNGIRGSQANRIFLIEFAQ